MTDYEIWLSDANGNRLALIPTDRITLLTYALVTNAVGSLTLEVPRDAIPDAHVMADGRLEVRRKPAGGHWTLEGQTVWLIQKMSLGVGREGRYRRLTALSANTLLARRYVMYFAGSASATATGAADDIMKAVVRSNLGATANSSPMYIGGTTPERTLGSLLTVDADVAAAPSATKEYGWRNVLSVLQDLANDAATNGTRAYFGLIWTGSGLIFRTWTGQPGVDRTAAIGQLTISAERGSLGGTVEATEDWTDSATWVVTGGQGQGTARLLGYAADAARVGRSPFGVRELFVNATSLSTSSSLYGEAYAELARRRPKKTLSGQVISVPGAVYGLDWGWGDRLIAQFEHDAFNALVETVSVKLEKGVETIDAKISGDAA